jgi:hypothetical protein
LFIISGGTAADVLTAHGYRFQIADSPEGELRMLRAFNPNAIVINKLNNSADYILGLRPLNTLIVTIDDSGEAARLADLNINVLYPIPGSLSDLKYVSLRQEFCRAHTRTRQRGSTVSEVLVMQGGSDTYGFTPIILDALAGSAPSLHFTVVAGPAFSHQSELDKALKSSGINATVVYSPRNIVELMERADLAISAGGITMFELCCLGVPGIIVCAERFEVQTADRLEREGAVMNLGFGGDLEASRLAGALNNLLQDPARRSSLSAAGHRLIDGRGSERIAAIVRSRAIRTETKVQ